MGNKIHVIKCFAQNLDNDTQSTPRSTPIKLDKPEIQTCNTPERNTDVKEGRKVENMSEIYQMIATMMKRLDEMQADMKEIKNRLEDLRRENENIQRDQNKEHSMCNKHLQIHELMGGNI
jgi:predicted nuclease with TOPRIM domain